MNVNLATFYYAGCCISWQFRNEMYSEWLRSKITPPTLNLPLNLTDSVKKANVRLKKTHTNFLKCESIFSTLAYILVLIRIFELFNHDLSFTVFIHKCSVSQYSQCNVYYVSGAGYARFNMSGFGSKYVLVQT